MNSSPSLGLSRICYILRIAGIPSQRLSEHKKKEQVFEVLGHGRKCEGVHLVGLPEDLR